MKAKMMKLITLGNIKFTALGILVIGLFLIVPSVMAYGMFVFSYFLGEVSQNIPILSSFFTRTQFPSAEMFAGAIGGVVCSFLFLVATKTKLDFSKKEVNKQ